VKIKALPESIITKLYKDGSGPAVSGDSSSTTSSTTTTNTTATKVKEEVTEEGGGAPPPSTEEEKSQAVAMEVDEPVEGAGKEVQGL